MNKLPPRKINFCSPSIWRKILIYQKTSIFKSADKFVYSRSSQVPPVMSKLKLLIHSGKRWKICIMNRWMTGIKFGELTWNRKMAVYKAKQKRKKKKK